MTRTQAWQQAIAAGDASMRAAGRADWSGDDFSAMVAEFDRLQPALEEIETAALWREVHRRRLANGQVKRRVVEQCVGCREWLSAAERRKPCPKCGARNPRNNGK